MFSLLFFGVFLHTAIFKAANSSADYVSVRGAAERVVSSCVGLAAWLGC